MSIHPFLDLIGAPSKFSGDSRKDVTTANTPFKHPTQVQTPPGSDSGSPKVKIEGFPLDSQEFVILPGLKRLNSPCDESPMRLPSLGEFDQGVEALARAHGPINPWTTSSTSSNIPRTSTTLQPLRPIDQPMTFWPPRPNSSECPAVEHPTSRRGTITSLSQYALAIDHARQSLQTNYINTDAYYGYAMSSPLLQAQTGMDCYPSPPPEGENRHINQKYTTEEGDFIIYAWHDKKMKWQRIKQEFATRFGRTPERTVQGLQAWYYRMNQRIPVWDQDGWLCFKNEEDLEPRYMTIKCRSQEKPTEPLGLAQRYPERAINYAWVDPELKLKAEDWGKFSSLFARDCGGANE
ncbi:hypothetical protein NM208_g8387 [Fusarium decemcellulare]|uniref:Uncharacterized protein n=1 Tax=Fusarium decemcellulare TaxID=57161 RepID=A0ACC1S5I1_9HYPO|nr:hypothetical protein NM208_g8387 [Fusarium decemcellulare]